MPKPATPPAPDDDAPAPPVVNQPPAPRAANKCPSCDAQLDGGKFCRECGARTLAGENGATDSGLESRVAALESDMGPLRKLGKALEGAGINLGDIGPEQVAQFKGLAGMFGGGPGGPGLIRGVGAALSGMLGIAPPAPPAAKPPATGGGK